MTSIRLEVSQSMSDGGWSVTFEYLYKQCEMHNIRSVAGTCVDDNRIVTYSFGDDSNLSGFIRKAVEFSPKVKFSFSH